MPKHCSICANGHLEQVNKLLASKKPLRQISARVFGDESHYRSIGRHAEHLGYDLILAKQNEDIANAIDFKKEVTNLYKRAGKMLTATEKWLSDPENADELDISPRSDELTVVYLDHSEKDEKGKPARKKATLHELLRRVEQESAYQPIAIHSSVVDTRKLFLDSFKTLTDRLDQYAKFDGLYQQDRTNDADRARELRSQLRSKAADAVIRELSSVIETLPDEYQARFSLDVESAYDEMITQLVEMDDDKLRELSLPFTKKDLMLLKS